MPERPHPARSTASRRVGRPAGPTAQGAASRDAIITAAAAVFSRLGYDRARMADIIGESGMSKGSVYFHFDSKEALAIAVLEDRHGRWIADVERAVSEGGGGQPRLRRLLPAMLSLHQQNPDAWVVSRLTQSLAAIESTRPLAASLTRRWVALVANLIRETGAQRAADAPIDAEMLATVLVGAFDGLKLTADALSGGDPVIANGLLVDGGRMLEWMLLQAVGEGVGQAERRSGGQGDAGSR